MFSGIKMDEFVESEHSGIFGVELVTKSVVFGSSGTRFMHMMVNRGILFVSREDRTCIKPPMSQTNTSYTSIHPLRES